MGKRPRIKTQVRASLDNIPEETQKRNRAIEVMMELYGLDRSQAAKRIDARIETRNKAHVNGWTASEATQYANGVAEAIEKFKKNKMNE